MKEEYKRRIKTQMDSALLRLKILDEVISGKRNGSQQDAKQYMKEALRSLEAANDIINIS